MPNARKATLNGVIDVIWPIQVRIRSVLFTLAPHCQNTEKVQNHGMSVVYQRLEANKDVQHRSKSGSWKQRVFPKLDLIPVQYFIIESF